MTSERLDLRQVAALRILVALYTLVGAVAVTLASGETTRHWSMGLLVGLLTGAMWAAIRVNALFRDEANRILFLYHGRLREDSSGRSSEEGWLVPVATMSELAGIAQRSGCSISYRATACTTEFVVHTSGVGYRYTPRTPSYLVGAPTSQA